MGRRARRSGTRRRHIAMQTAVEERRARPPLDAALLTLRPRLRRFARSPKGYLLIAFAVLAVVAVPATGLVSASVTLIAAVAGAALPELGFVRLRRGRWRFPSSAILTGLIVGFVLSPQEAWLVSATAGVIATLSKHTVRIGRSHIFNPAAVGLLAVYLLFATGQSWWGALAGLPAPFIVALIAAGYVVADRANKLPAAFAFATTYVVLFALASFVGDPSSVQEIFRPPFIQVAVFFAAFMVTDPPTSPVPFSEQVWFGALVAGVAYIIYMWTHGLYFVLVGSLVGNVAYAVWRIVHRRSRIGLFFRPA